jgi:hypothetical protein
VYPRERRRPREHTSEESLQPHCIRVAGVVICLRIVCTFRGRCPWPGAGIEGSNVVSQVAEAAQGAHFRRIIATLWHSCGNILRATCARLTQTGSGWCLRCFLARLPWEKKYFRRLPPTQRSRFLHLAHTTGRAEQFFKTCARGRAK